MSIENLTSVVTDPCHVTDPGARLHPPRARGSRLRVRPGVPGHRPGSAGPRTPEPGPAARPGPGLPQRHETSTDADDEADLRRDPQNDQPSDSHRATALTIARPTD
jgi:hypothetical protein